MPAHGVRRLCVAVDIEKYSHRGAPRHAAAQGRLLRVLGVAAAAGNVPRSLWIRQPSGDGELSVLPAGIDEPRFVRGFVAALRDELAAPGGAAGAGLEPLRLRVAIHEGPVDEADNGFAGDTVIDVCRMCDAAHLRKALERHAGSGFVLALSDPVYRGVITPRYGGLAPEDFWPATLVTKDRSLSVHLHVPDPAVRTEPQPVPSVLREAGRYAVVAAPVTFDGTRPDVRAAGEIAGSLGGVLSVLGYELPQGVLVEPDAGQLSQAFGLAAAAAREQAAVVVGVISHAEAGRSGRTRIAPSGGSPSYDVDAWLDDVEDADVAAPTLLVLDACHTDHLIVSRTQLAGDRRTWIISALGGGEVCAGRLTRALTSVLWDLADGELDLDETVRHVPPQRIRREIQRVLDAAGEQPPLRVVGVDGVGEPPFFPNPAHARDRPGPLSAAAGDFAAHLGDLALLGGVRARDGALGLLGEWLHERAQPPLLFITGRAGAGKSALLSVAAGLTDEGLRAGAPGVFGALPGGCGPLAAEHPHALVQLRGRSVDELTVQVRRAIDPGAVDALDDIEGLLSAFGRLSVAPVLVVDGLDEAADPGAVEATLLRPLLTTAGWDGRPLCRMLVSARPDERWRWLRALPRYIERDLDTAVETSLGAQLAALAARIVRAEGGWAEPCADTFGQAVAVRLTTEQPEVGEFLLARAYAEQASAVRPMLSDAAAAEGLGSAVPTGITTMLRLDLLRVGTSRWLGPLLAGFAQARGDGMPAEIAALIAERLAGEPAAPDDLGRAAAQAGFYLRRAVDTDGTPLFRLYHQSLVDALRQDPQLLLEVAR
ncbi:hypothetical protein ABZS66_25585 [Dactylosporangium sp. NPDC005572]|uniref:hypothetical protein n=1 Tax=Dactylosporangium sp. NPDC005572 TaxID=3156889 RepID=UPI0033BE8C98